MSALSGRTIAFLTSQTGVEKSELTDPWAAVEGAGGTPEHVAPEADTVQSMVGDVDKDETFRATVAVADADVARYDALVVPGGTVNADTLRTNAQAVALVKAFVEASKPVAAICHGPWVLVEAGVLPGKTLTSFPSLQTDVRNAGGTWQDHEVFHCRANGWDLITSRKPDDLPAFNDTIIEVVANR
ncbi:type 1 glutamine amidotransferase domain-containing protein [Aeromicrobium sp. CTD01-1L150]|uniref:type 1 glutamine amidotransferase domain-containing protein n=1 Tax=Aeromicrobium sp. CTD01-1L150 TaxID=3341830 RepID=UPI0035C21EE1